MYHNEREGLFRSNMTKNISFFLGNTSRKVNIFFVGQDQGVCQYKNKFSQINIHLEKLISAKANFLRADRTKVHEFALLLLEMCSTPTPQLSLEAHFDESKEQLHFLLLASFEKTVLLRSKVMFHDLSEQYIPKKRHQCHARMFTNTGYCTAMVKLKWIKTIKNIVI